ncbi:glutamate receptor ionotropic, kainate glr-3-like [Euwallacea similis]|uniref:glutamate receptor ionotropic, kainate glr-3-like n=1 Tax=Euwallacea similis TaxID=1736056 RepID=UPI00344F2889
MISDSNDTFNIPLGVVAVKSDTLKLPEILFNNFGCQNFVFYDVKNVYKTLLWIESEVLKCRESFHLRKYLVIDAVVGDWWSHVGECFNEVLFVEIHVIDGLNLLLPNNRGIEATFWAPQCPHQTSVILDKWFSGNKSFLLGSNLFPNKLNNLHRHAIKVGTFNYRPFAIIDKASFYVSGADIQILRAIQHSINASIELILNEDLWGRPYDDGTSTGVEGGVYRGELDVGAAGFFLDASALQFFDSTTVYLDSVVTFLVPAPRLLPPWLSLTYGFSSHTWIALCLTYTLLAVAMYFLSWYQTRFQLIKPQKQNSLIQETILTVGSLMIQQSVPQRQYQHKILLTLTMLAIIAINIAYNAGYASIMTKPLYGDTIDSLQKFIESDIHWGGTGLAEWIKIWRENGEGQHKKVADRYIQSTAARLRELSLQGNFTFQLGKIAGQPHIESYIKEDVINQYRVMKEIIHSELICMITKRNYLLLPAMNKVIRRLSQAGIIEYWSREYYGHEEYIMRIKLQLEKEFGPEDEHVMLGTEHLLGAFCIFLLGNSLSLVMFLYEVAGGKY